jgi:hypothetical protein
MPRLRPLPKERLHAIWGACHAFIRNNGPAWITTMPGAWPLTLECLPDSALPELLRDKGYIVGNAGSQERYLPEPVVITLAGGRGDNKITTDRLVATAVQLWSISLP